MKCKVKNCNKKYYAKGYCGMHYQRVLKFGTPGPTKELKVKSLTGFCVVSGCKKKHLAKGFCLYHWRESRKIIMPKCKVKGCAKDSYSDGVCSMHSNRIKKYGKPDDKCQVKNCSEPYKGKGYCHNHLRSFRKYGNTLTGIRTYKGYSINPKGYKRIHIGQGKTILEHKMIMEQYLGRKLLTHENIHHKNGDRLDNRIDNLELWSTAQPCGQRAKDKLQWAIEIIKLYDKKLKPF